MSSRARNTLIVAAALAVAAIATVAALEQDIVGEAVGSGEITEAEVLDRSIGYLERKYQPDPYNYVLAARLSDRYRLRFKAEAKLSDLERSEELARRVLRHSPDSAASHARLSQLALSQHDFVRAFEQAQRAVAADEDDVGALAALYDAADATGQSAVAESALARLPRSDRGYSLRLARWQASDGKLGAAIQTHRELCGELAERPTPDQVRAWCLTQLAGLELARSGPDAARRRFEQALQVRAGYRGALEGLADLAYADRRWERAEELNRRILADAHPDLYLRMSEVLAAQGEETEAARFEKRFLRVVAAGDDRALFTRPLAYYYARRPSTRDHALSLARRDLQRRPAAESYETLAWVHLRRNEFNRALAMSDTARTLVEDPGPTSDYHRARVLLEIGRVSEATELLERVEAAEPALLSHHALRAIRLEGRTGSSLVVSKAAAANER